MAVYVDKSKNPFGRMKMCHMLADTMNELHAMACLLGLKRDWFQSGSTPHYDLSLAKRELAIKAGAIEIDRKQTVSIIRRLRAYPDLFTREMPRPKQSCLSTTGDRGAMTEQNFNFTPASHP